MVPAQGAPGEGGAASSQSDPALKQTVKDDERFAPRGQKHAFTKGHADLGVRLEGDGAKGGSSEGNDGGLTMMLRDDSKEQPVWRHLEDVAFVVGRTPNSSCPKVAITNSPVLAQVSRSTFYRRLKSKGCHGWAGTRRALSW